MVMIRRYETGLKIMYRPLFFTCCVAFIIALLSFGACDRYPKKEKISEKIYATVDGSQLTESELQSLVPMEFYHKMTTQQKNEIVREWVNRELLYQEALRIGLDKDPVIEKILKKSSHNLLSNELLERRLAIIKTPGEDELIKYYKDHQNFFLVQGNEYKIRYALFDNITEARDFWKQVKGGGSFSDLARVLSKDSGAQHGGDLGIINEDAVEPEVWNAIHTTLDKLGIGKISDPFSVINGWGIIIVDKAYDEGTVKPYDSVRDQALDFFMSEKRDNVKRALIDELTRRSSITYHFNGL